jgi:hypothetical protein
VQRSIRTLLLSLPCLAGCASTSASFVEGHPGFAVVKGRVQEVQDLDSREMTALSDGVAFTVAGGRCIVRIRFDDGREERLELMAPGMLICGAATDYVLRPLDAAPRE